MILERRTDLDYIPQLLEARYPVVARELKKLLAIRGTTMGVVVSTKDICVRDFLPVQLDGDGDFVSFGYVPDYSGATSPSSPGRSAVSRLPRFDALGTPGSYWTEGISSG